MSRVEKLEGRRTALAALGSVQGMPVAFVQQSEVVANLRATAKARSGDWAEGVLSVLAVVGRAQ